MLSFASFSCSLHRRVRYLVLPLIYRINILAPFNKEAKKERATIHSKRMRMIFILKMSVCLSVCGLHELRIPCVWLCMCMGYCSSAGFVYESGVWLFVCVCVWMCVESVNVWKRRVWWCRSNIIKSERVKRVADFPVFQARKFSAHSAPVQWENELVYMLC